MKTFIKHIEKILKTDDRLWSKDDDKKILKNKLVELVSNDDEKLLELLIKDSEAKKHFFKKIRSSTIFLKDRFLQFITMNEFLPDSFTAFENEIGLSGDKKLITQKDEISLIFPHKDCILEGGQTKEEIGRDEIFYNTILAPDEIDRIKEPKALVNWKKYDKDGKHEVKKISKQDNLIIKGNNLLTLYSLLLKYRDEIKLIYIDPPYNTGNDGFGYNDKFNHSAWLTFMQNRLEVAKDLLADDGVIFVQCDHHELGYLNILMNDIFNEKNKIQIISIKTSSTAGFKTVNPGPIDTTEYILYYAKDKKKVSFKKGFVPVGYNSNYNLFITNIKDDSKKWKLMSIVDVFYKENGIKNNKDAKNKFGNNWKIIRDVLIEDFALKNADRIVSKRDPHKPTDKLKKLLQESQKSENVIEIKRDNENSLYLYKGGSLAFYKNKLKEIDGKITPTELLTDFWQDISWAGIANEGGVGLKNGKKPEKLLQRIIDIASNENDIVLDFFAGAGTAGAVAHKMGRKYILIEQMDYIHDLPEARLVNVIKGDQTGISKAVNWKGGGSFIYTELLEWNQKYIDQLEKAKTKKEILAIYKKIEKEEFYKYKYEVKKFDLKKFKELDLKEQKRALLDILDMNHLYVNKSSIDDATFKVDKKDKKLTKIFYEEK